MWLLGLKRAFLYQKWPPDGNKSDLNYIAKHVQHHPQNLYVVLSALEGDPPRPLISDHFKMTKWLCNNNKKLPEMGKKHQKKANKLLSALMGDPTAVTLVINHSVFINAPLTTKVA